MKYEIELSVDLGEAIPEVGSLVSGLNHHMSSVGFHDKLHVMSRVGLLTFESPEPLTKEQEETVKSAVNRSLSEQFAGVKIHCTNVSRQSGNVQQSAS